MSIKSGYIQLHRSLLDWEWYSDLATRSLFIHCLLKANWKDKVHRGKVIKRGTFVTSREKLAAETGLTIKQVRRALKNLETTNEVANECSRQGSVITVVKYDEYQKGANERADKGPTEGPEKGQQEGRKRATTNNINKYKKETFGHFWEAYPKKKNKGDAQKAWMKLDHELMQGIIEHVQARAARDESWLKDGGQYIPYPSTFLNGQRWEDEYQTNVTPIRSDKPKISDRFIRIHSEKARKQGYPEHASTINYGDVLVHADGTVKDISGRRLA